MKSTIHTYKLGFLLIAIAAFPLTLMGEFDDGYDGYSDDGYSGGGSDGGSANTSNVEIFPHISEDLCQPPPEYRNGATPGRYGICLGINNDIQAAREAGNYPQEKIEQDRFENQCTTIQYLFDTCKKELEFIADYSQQCSAHFREYTEIGCNSTCNSLNRDINQFAQKITGAENRFARCGGDASCHSQNYNDILSYQEQKTAKENSHQQIRCPDCSTLHSKYTRAGSNIKYRIGQYAKCK